MSSVAAEEERGKEEEEKSVPDDNNNGGDVIVLRRDLVDTWPTGSVVAQGCHASVAAIWAHRDNPDTVSYLSDTNIDSMHKVALEVKGEIQIRNLSEKLKAGGIEHKLWMEQPENFPTCLATRPYLLLQETQTLQVESRKRKEENNLSDAVLCCVLIVASV